MSLMKLINQTPTEKHSPNTLPAGTGTNVNKEILEEAYIMASVDHPNLLQLLAVCMTTQIMLVTQLMPLGCLLDYVRNNKDKVRCW